MIEYKWKTYYMPEGTRLFIRKEVAGRSSRWGHELWTKRPLHHSQSVSHPLLCLYRGFPRQVASVLAAYLLRCGGC